MKVLKDLLQDAHDEEEDLSNMVLGYEADERTLNEKLNDTRTKLAVAKGKKTSLDNSIEALCEEADKLNAEKAEKEARYEQLGNDIKTVENLDKVLQSDTEQTSQDSAAVQQRENELGKKLEEVRNRKESLNLEKVEAESALQRALSEIAHLDETLERLHGENERYNETLEQKTEQLNECNDNIENLNLTNSDTTATEEIDAKINEVESRLNAIDKRYQEVEKEFDDATMRWSNDITLAEKARARMESLQEDLAREEWRIGNEYDLDYEGAKQILDAFAQKGYLYPENMLRLRKAELLAEKYGCSVPEINIRYIFSSGMNLFAIVSTTSADRLKMDLCAASEPLSPEDVAFLESDAPASL